jgi:hypothetical protein
LGLAEIGNGYGIVERWHHKNLFTILLNDYRNYPGWAMHRGSARAPSECKTSLTKVIKCY